MARKKETSEPRQRILETADRLFYGEGIRAVGIDRIIAEAGVAKMTLYSHFPSKDDLILAVLKSRDDAVFKFFRESMARHAKRTTDSLQAFFAALREFFVSREFRGCAFINASVELAESLPEGKALVRDHKERFGAFLRDVLEQATGKAAGRLAPAIALLVEGAIVTAMIQESPDAAEVARDAAAKLIRDSR